MDGAVVRKANWQRTISSRNHDVLVHWKILVFRPNPLVRSFWINLGHWSVGLSIIDRSLEFKTRSWFEGFALATHSIDWP